ncbi:sigma-70 family RNA polymerase sigma factor [Chitinophaga sp. Cy-1792]|uniref:RNA polymerase sigma factor n=1 Tax=Chitinophaga sp. Cy-1792 TaxID=2608339 RepID=UPI001422D243
MPALNAIQEERDILARISRSDEAAFGQLFDHYRDRVYGLALKLTESEQLAEEIVLDVFLKIWLKKDMLPEIEHFTAYLYTTTRNHVFSTLKQLSVRRNAEDAVRVEEYLLHSSQTDYAVMDKQYREILEQAVSQLSPRQREVYRLIKEQGLKREEAAAQLALSPETVKRHLAEAMYAIRVYCLARLDVVAVIMILQRLH